MRVTRKIVFLILYMLFAYPALAEAVTIPLLDSITGKNSGWEMIVSPALMETGEIAMPYVYGITDEAVVIELDKTFNHPPEGMYFNPHVVEFQKASADAVANIIIEDERIVNDTGVGWMDFHIYLMVNILAPQAGFNPNFIPDGGQLEKVYYSDNSGYAGLPIQLHFINTSGDGVPASPPGDDVFQPGYFGGRIVIATDPAAGVGTRFGLKEVPTIPEPVTVLLFGVGCALAGFVRKDKSARLR